MAITWNNNIYPDPTTITNMTLNSLSNQSESTIWPQLSILESISMFSMHFAIKFFFPEKYVKVIWVTLFENHQKLFHLSCILQKLRILALECGFYCSTKRILIANKIYYYIIIYVCVGCSSMLLYFNCFWDKNFTTVLVQHLLKVQKQPSIGVFVNRCSKNMQ